MFLRELKKSPFPTHQSQEHLKCYKRKEVPDTSIKTSEEQIPKVNEQTHLLMRLLQHKFRRPSKPQDKSLSRSTLPFSRAAPTGLSRCNRSRVGRTHDRANRLPLGRRRRPKKKKSHQKQMQDLRKSTNSYSPVTTTSRSGAPLSSLHRLDGRLVRRPVLDVQRRPTSQRTCNKIQLQSNKDPTEISNQNTRQKKSDAHLSQYAPKAHLQAVEAYSDSFRD